MFSPHQRVSPSQNVGLETHFAAAANTELVLNTLPGVDMSVCLNIIVSQSQDTL